MAWLSKESKPALSKLPFPERCGVGQQSRPPSVRQILLSLTHGTILNLAKKAICYEVIFFSNLELFWQEHFGFGVGPSEDSREACLFVSSSLLAFLQSRIKDGWKVTSLGRRHAYFCVT